MSPAKKMRREPRTAYPRAAASRAERSAPVVLGVSRANYDVSDTDLVALDDLRHVCEATELTPESPRHDDVHLVVEHAQ